MGGLKGAEEQKTEQNTVVAYYFVRKNQKRGAEGQERRPEKPEEKHKEPKKTRRSSENARPSKLGRKPQFAGEVWNPNQIMRAARRRKEERNKYGK